ncbi:MAG: hypothetical protein SGARI_001097 [Bacillariaceae sp.]
MQSASPSSASSQPSSFSVSPTQASSSPSTAVSSSPSLALSQAPSDLRDPLPQPGFPVPCDEESEADCLLYALNNCISMNNPDVDDGDRCFYGGLGDGGLRRRRKLEAELQYHYDALASLKYA